MLIEFALTPILCQRHSSARYILYANVIGRLRRIGAS